MPKQKRPSKQSPVVRRVRTPAEETEAYWTEARMANAAPRPLGRSMPEDKEEDPDDERA